MFNDTANTNANADPFVNFQLPEAYLEPCEPSMK